MAKQPPVYPLLVWCPQHGRRPAGINLHVGSSATLKNNWSVCTSCRRVLPIPDGRYIWHERGLEYIPPSPTYQIPPAQQPGWLPWSRKTLNLAIGALERLDTAAVEDVAEAIGAVGETSPAAAELIRRVARPTWTRAQLSTAIPLLCALLGLMLASPSNRFDMAQMVAMVQARVEAEDAAKLATGQTGGPLALPASTGARTLDPSNPVMATAIPSGALSAEEDPLMARLAEVIALPDGWFGPDSHRVSPGVVAAATALLPEIASLEPRPVMGPRPDGSIAFELSLGTKHLIATIESDGREMFLCADDEVTSLLDEAVQPYEPVRLIRFLSTGSLHD